MRGLACGVEYLVGKLRENAKPVKGRSDIKAGGCACVLARVC